MTRQCTATRRCCESDSLCLSFILVYLRGKVSELSIETYRNRTKSIGPFLRGEKVFGELEYSLRDEDIVFFDSLHSIGMSTLPFTIPVAHFTKMPIREWISAGCRLFKKIGAFGSIRPIQDDPALPKNPIPAEMGMLVGGVVYVHISPRISSCRLKFRYDGLPYLVGAFHSSMPIRREDGGFIVRNLKEEKNILEALLECGVEVDSKGAFALSADALTQLIRNPPAQISFLAEKMAYGSSSHRGWTQSGIKWFDSDEDVDSTDFLDAYLEGRNYVQLSHSIGLFDQKTIANRVERDFVKAPAASDPSRRLMLIASHIRKVKNLGEIDSYMVMPRYLKDWQRKGTAWLLGMKSQHVGAILADEMGLGKTVQTIAFLAMDWIMHEKKTQNLIICPASVVENWEREIEKFEPSLAAHIFSPNQSFFNINSGFCIISYERAVKNLSVLKRSVFENIVLDEAQKIKNSETQSFQALFNLNSKFRMMLTGTPIENTITELWNHVSFVNPDTFGAMRSFRERYPVFDNPQKFAKFSFDLLSCFVLVRRKQDVNIILPPMTEHIVKCRMDYSQANLYESTRKKFAISLKNGTAARVSSLALEALLRLRQCCCDPTMLPTTLNTASVKNSCKLDAAFRIILQGTQLGGKILVFTQFIEVIERLKVMLLDVGMTPYVLTGVTNNRQNLVDSFNQDQNSTVFLISLKAGGVGMNLASANTIILFDPWWNPAVESQAFARAHRLGQKKPVDVFKLICVNTVEEKMMDLEDFKRSLASGLTEHSPSVDEMLSLIGIHDKNKHNRR